MTSAIDSDARSGRLYTTVLVVTATAAVAALAGAGIGYLPALGKFVPILLVGALVIALKPELCVYATFVLAFTTFPISFQFGKDIGLFTILPYEVAALVGIWALLRSGYRTRPVEVWPILAFLLTILYSTTLGVINGNDSIRIARETQFLLDLVIGYVLMLLVVKAGIARQIAYVLVPVLWVSAALIIVSSFTGLQLEGRADDLHVESASEQGVRFITNTQMLATVVLCAAVAFFLLGLGERRFFLLAVPPAATISLLSFSRNLIIALGVTLVVCVLFSRTLRVIPRLLGLLIGIGVTFGAIVPLLTLATAGTVGGAWIENQVHNFQSRVFSGVSSSYLARDPSLQDRLLENNNLYRSISEEPWLGHGAGYAYKSHFGTPSNYIPEPNSAYAHNFYLWWATKAGIIVLIIFAVFALIAIGRALMTGSRYATTAGAISAALLAVSAVAPLPLDPANSILLGMTLGTAAALARAPMAANSTSTVTDRRQPVSEQAPSPAESGQ